MKKKIIVIFIILLIVLLIPIRLQAKDGGTVEYRAVLYSVSNVHRIKDENTYYEGTIVKILGIEVYNNVK